MYAFVFVLVNATYLWLIHETQRDNTDELMPNSRSKLLHLRALITLSIFATAMIIAIWLPLVGFGLIVCCLLVYLRPELRA